MLRKTLISLSVDRWGQCSHSVGCLDRGIPALKLIGCWVGPGLGEEMASSRRARGSEYSPELPQPASLSQYKAIAAPCLYRRLSATK